MGESNEISKETNDKIYKEVAEDIYSSIEKIVKRTGLDINVHFQLVVSNSNSKESMN